MSCPIRLLLITLGAIAAGAAGADVTVESSYDVEAAGPLGMLASSGTVVSRVSGDKARTDSNVQSKSKMVGMFGGGGESADITRLDLGLTRQLNPNNRTYTEATFEEMRQMMAAGLQQAEAVQQQAATGPQDLMPVTQQNCEWTNAKTEVFRTGETAVLAGLKAERATIRFSQTCSDIQTGKSCDMVWTMDQWLAANVPGSSEMRLFWERYAKALGMEQFVGEQTQGGIGIIVQQFKAGWDSALQEAAKLQGHPIKTVMEMQIGGDQCTMDNGSQIASAEIFADAAASAQNAAVDQAASETGAAVARETSGMFGNSAGGRVAGSAIGAFGKQVSSGVFGRFKKKNQPPATEPAATTTTQSNATGHVMLFRVTNETNAIYTNSIDQDLFELQPGWKKVERPAWPPAASP